MTACHYKEKDKKQSESIGLTNQPTHNGQALGKYTEKYQYDPSGNIILFDHINHTYRTHWKRYQKYGDDSNRILSSMAKDQEYDAAFTEIISEVPACENADDIPHDLNGNIEALAHLRVRQNSSDPIYKNLKWNFKNELVQAELNQSGNTACYQYDASGQRVRKTVVKGSTIEERIYLGGYEIYHKRNGQNGTNLKLKRQTLHVMDDKKRIALVETRTAGDDPDDSRWRRFRYQLDNHLGSSVMEIEWAKKDQNGQWEADILSYEEYYPYGDTAYIAGRSKDNEIAPEVKRKRYRYSGKERDDETTGLYYYGARYYASWLGRWVSCDPLSKKNGTNSYYFVKNTPIRYKDLRGLKESPTEAEELTLTSDPEFHNIKECIDVNGGSVPELSQTSTKQLHYDYRRTDNFKLDLDTSSFIYSKNIAQSYSETKKGWSFASGIDVKLKLGESLSFGVRDYVLDEVLRSEFNIQIDRFKLKYRWETDTTDKKMVFTAIEYAIPISKVKMVFGIGSRANYNDLKLWLSEETNRYENPILYHTVKSKLQESIIENMELRSSIDLDFDEFGKLSIGLRAAPWGKYNERFMLRFEYFKMFTYHRAQYVVTTNIKEDLANATKNYLNKMWQSGYLAR